MNVPLRINRLTLVLGTLIAVLCSTACMQSKPVITDSVVDPATPLVTNYEVTGSLTKRLVLDVDSPENYASISLYANDSLLVDKLNVPVPVANLAATFGATIGQNGCAGIYPAMLATMVAPSMGINPMDPSFIAALVGIVAISSFGVAGVGGGATFAALIVLPSMGFPIALVALLISIEPLIDMARTALNVNGSMTAGVLTGRLLKDLPAEAPLPIGNSATSSE